MNEAQTRQELIDKALRLAGWDVADRSQVTQELPIATGPAAVALPIVPAALASTLVDSARP